MLFKENVILFLTPFYNYTIFTKRVLVIYVFISYITLHKANITNITNICGNWNLSQI